MPLGGYRGAGSQLI